MNHVIPATTLQRTYLQALRTHYPSYLTKVFHTLNPGQSYINNWHLDAIAEYLSAMQEGTLQRLIINMPPRSLKSVSITVGWSAYLLGHQPETRIITASYASGISLKHAMDTRSIMASPWYRSAFPATQLMSGQNEKHKCVTTQHGFRLATSVGGTLTGEGGDIIILDDPISPSQAMSETWRNRANQWFDHTLSSRLNDKQTGRILVVMQRLHEDDLSGYLLRKGGWEHLCLPAQVATSVAFSYGNFQRTMQAGDVLQASREPDQVLKQIQQDVGSMAYAAQYMQQPFSQTGHMIQASWLIPDDHLPWPTTFDTIVQSWDTAIKTGQHHDLSACVTIGVLEGYYYLLDCFTDRLAYPNLKRAILGLYDQYQPDIVLIEDKASGQSLLQDIRLDNGALPLKGIIPRQDKVSRVSRITPMLETGQLRFPAYASWWDKFYVELLGFPHGKHDDQVDALSQALLWLKEQRSRERYLIRSL